MKVEQLDLFGDNKEKPLNGMYYERSTDKFVSYVLGERYWEIEAKKCRDPKEWRERIKRERYIP